MVFPLPAQVLTENAGMKLTFQMQPHPIRLLVCPPRLFPASLLMENLAAVCCPYSPLCSGILSLAFIWPTATFIQTGPLLWPLGPGFHLSSILGPPYLSSAVFSHDPYCPIPASVLIVVYFLFLMKLSFSPMDSFLS